ncbi:hypothetical protein [Flavilitoribacter nigricans]|uniref:Phosphoadenosine phosphosulphate reductase domain-containing protein n=1 Tax=Flavilitoribacter nigricans (strain ATCC 23147 / DSM 23189 / NBRC 102662 / NCIMB 1420 / SS-2) TaxID=1122177 RepID=A0A2D0NCC2_FLAN2|nr:hypothetical protein [Flavilitoribacter nigricans]PHN06151.1 hypothetical protein CRP01_11240 [Flavilitoribacter nigricans DSM 23189 = NBRC 102662]
MSTITIFNCFGEPEQINLESKPKIRPVNDYIPTDLKTVNSMSGGKTSAYVAAHYPAGYNVFSLVRIEDSNCRFKDEKIRRLVEDRIQAPFIGTAEDDTIIYTILDLEQYLGTPIHWVTGPTFDWIVKNAGGWLPNKLHRYCTTEMKIRPIFEWVWRTIGEPVTVRIGYRANETKRARKMIDRLNENGLLTIKHSFRKWETGIHKGKNRWEHFQWQRPEFPLIRDRIYKCQIENYWELKPVRFAPFNNCVGCFHRNPVLLRKQFDWHPEKMNWFQSQEGGKNGYWRSDLSYETIGKHNLQVELDVSAFSECDSGFCEG